MFLDLFSRQGAGWAMSTWMTADWVIDALQIARWRRRPGKGLRVHSGRYIEVFYNRQRKH